MNGRMSKLRRSLSRSVHQLNSVIPLSRSQSNLLELPPSIYSTLVDRFASVQTFNQLRQLVAINNDGLREIISIFEEKSAMDFAYAKSMHKLSTRLQRVSQNAQCEIDRGWSSIAEQFQSHATIHSNLGSSINDDVVQPLRSIQNNEMKTIKTAEVLVDREMRKLKEKKEEVGKMKKNVYLTSKELEKLEQLIDADSNNAQKFSLRRKKLKDQVERGEDDYIFTTIDVEKQRRTTYGVLRKAVESLEAVERQRLAHCQTALGRLQRKIEQLGPNLQQMFERYTNSLDSAVQSNASEYITTLQPSTSAAHYVTLVDLYAENFSEIILGERRRLSLTRISGILDSELRRMYGKMDGTAIAQLSANAKEMSGIEFVEYLYYKINEAINAGDGGKNRGFHRLARFQQKTKDKQGLPHTVLSIPLSDDVFHTPYSTHSTTIDNEENYYEEYDKISDEGFYNSSGPRSTDEPTVCQTVQSVNTSPQNLYTDNIHQIEPSPSSPPPPDVSTVPSSPPSTVYPQLEEERARKSTVIDDPATICRVLYDFSATDPDELSVNAGDCVIVEERLGDDWLVGRIINGPGQSGRFPTTYVAF